MRDPDTLEPAPDEAYDIINRMKDRGILLSVDGPLHNVLKIKPPMVIAADDIERVIESLDEVLSRLV